MLKLRLYQTTEDEILRSDPANDGLDEAMELLAALQDQGIEVEKIDIDQLSDKDIQEAYMDAVYPSVRQKFAIRQVFGTRRKSASFFGTGVPALLVYEGEDEHPVDVYPHQELNRLVTIRDFLQELVKEEEVGRASLS